MTGQGARAPLGAGVPPPAGAELIERLSWLITLRWVAVGGVAVALTVARFVLTLPLALPQLAAILAALAAYNALLSALLARLRRERDEHLGPRPFALRLVTYIVLVPVFVLMGVVTLANLGRSTAAALRGRHAAIARPRHRTLAHLLVPRAWWGIGQGWDVAQAAALASAQISFDLLALAALIHFSGGIENPFIYYFIFHVIISSILLSRRATYLLAAFGLVLVSCIGLGECFGWLPHHAITLRLDYADPMFVLGQLLALGSTLLLSAYMAGSISARLRFRERDAALLSRAVDEEARQLEAAYRRLAEAEQAKSAYMRKVSHELRGPLGTIQTALKVVLGGLAGDLDPRSRDLVERAQRRAGELADVTQDLLALSRAREGRLGVEMQAVRLVDLAREVVADAGERARAAGLALTLDACDDALELRGDPQSLRQLLSNLVSNAIRYTRPGGTVAVRLERAGERAVVEVQDSGIGIPAEDLGRIFEEFYRSANARDLTSDGSGLGLAIVHAAAQQHGGRVTVESTVGIGTLFRVDLPLVPAARGGQSGNE